MGASCVFHYGQVNAKSLRLLPVGLVTFIRHSIAGLQQQNLVQLQSESVNVRDSEELSQPSAFDLRQLLSEL